LGFCALTERLQFMNFKNLLADLQNGNAAKAFEAARALSKRARSPVKKVIAVLNEAENICNREAAAHALAWTFGRRNQEPLEALLATFDKLEESSAVRAQALEGFNLQSPSKRNRLWSRVEAAVVRGLEDESPEVRFWACYAAGMLPVKVALPKLCELAQNDSAVCLGWWRVSEEAADAIEGMHGRDTPPRVPMSRQIETESA